MTDGTKSCVICGGVVVRNPRFSRAQWESTLCCSKPCAARLGASRRPDPRGNCADCGILAKLVKGRCVSCHGAWRWRTDPEYRERHQAAQQVFRERHPQYTTARSHREAEKWTARDKVAKAIATGRLARLPCEVCAQVDAQAHHDDYSQPLTVRWLCSVHHAEHHRAQRREDALS